MRYLAVLMTVHNRKAITLNCLERLYVQEIPSEVKMHVYLTNDGCTDGTPEAIREQFPEVNIIDGDGNLYWNRGMWTAWDKASHIDPITKEPSSTAKYDWYLWLNDDTELLSNAICDIIGESERHSEVPCILVGATKASDSERLTYGGRINKLIPPCEGKSTKIEYFNGNIVLVCKSAFKLLGNLDYYYSHSKGDYDYGVRAKREGVKVYQCGKVLGICDQHKSLDRWCNPQTPVIERMKLLYKPTGMPPHETFHLEKKQFGLCTAAYHWFTVHLRCLCPSLWVK